MFGSVKSSVDGVACKLSVDESYIMLEVLMNPPKMFEVECANGQNCEEDLSSNRVG